jgi:hypothetical protein
MRNQSKALVPPPPIGVWRCTHSIFETFVVGEEYPCIRSPAGDLRIYPTLETTAWSPLWSEADERFCYEKEDLDFTYVRSISYETEAVLTELRDTPGPKNQAYVQSLMAAEVDIAPEAQLPRKSKMAALIRMGAAAVFFFLMGVIVTLLGLAII